MSCAMGSEYKCDCVHIGSNYGYLRVIVELFVELLECHATDVWENVGVENINVYSVMYDGQTHFSEKPILWISNRYSVNEWKREIPIQVEVKT